MIKYWEFRFIVRLLMSGQGPTDEMGEYLVHLRRLIKAVVQGM